MGGGGGAWRAERAGWRGSLRAWWTKPSSAVTVGVGCGCEARMSDGVAVVVTPCGGCAAVGRRRRGGGVGSAGRPGLGRKCPTPGASSILVAFRSPTGIDRMRKGERRSRRTSHRRRKVMDRRLYGKIAFSPTFLPSQGSNNPCSTSTMFDSLGPPVEERVRGAANGPSAGSLSLQKVGFRAA